MMEKHIVFISFKDLTDFAEITTESEKTHRVSLDRWYPFSANVKVPTPEYVVEYQSWVPSAPVSQSIQIQIPRSSVNTRFLRWWSIG